MSVTHYLLLASLLDLMVGVCLGFIVRRSKGPFWLLASAASASIVFASLAGFIIVHEASVGQGLLPGLAWAYMYAPSNAILSQGAAACCLLTLRVVQRRSTLGAMGA